MLFNPKALTGANVFLDGIGLLGVLKDFEPPKLEAETIEVSGSIGKKEMVLPTLKPLSAKLTLSDVNAPILASASSILPKLWKIKANIASTHLSTTFEKVTVLVGGHSKIVELSKFEMNGEIAISIEIAVNTFTYSIDDIPLIVYDYENSIYMIDGIDQYLTIRKNIM